MIIYAENSSWCFPCLVRLTVEVSSDERKSGRPKGNDAADTRNFVFSRNGKRPILRSTVNSRLRAPFPIRISAWH